MPVSYTHLDVYKRQVLARVKELRAEGEALHKAGDHNESVKVLGEALDLLSASE